MVFEKVARWLDELLEKFKRGNRRGMVVTLLAIARLKEKGLPLTLANIVEEVKRIIREKPEVDWGVREEEYTEEYAGKLLAELEEVGILEPADPLEPPPQRKWRIRQYEEADPVAEIYARFGSLLLYGGPHPGARA